MNKTLTLIIAASGSGKSTLAHKLKAENLDTVICSADYYFIKNGVYTFSPTNLGSAHQQCQNMAHSAMARGKPTIIDNTNATWKDFQIYLTFASIHGYDVVFNVFLPKKDTDLDALLDVLTARNSHRVPREAIKRQLSNVIALNKSLTRDMKSAWPHLKSTINKLEIKNVKA